MSRPRQIFFLAAITRQNVIPEDDLWEDLPAPPPPQPASPPVPRQPVSLKKTVADLEKKTEPEPPAADASLIEVMRHRLGLTYEAEAEELTSEILIAQVLEKIPVPAV